MADVTSSRRTVPAGLSQMPFLLTRRQFLRVTGGLTGAALLAACGVDQTSPPDEAEGTDPGTPAATPARGGVLTMGLPSALVHINPVPHSETAFLENVALSMYDQLWKVQDDGTHVPHLAEEWEQSDDLNVTTIRIREGVEFHDGRPLTAEDVAYSIGLRIDPDLVSAAGTLGLMDPRFFDSIEVLDDRTVRINCTAPFRVLDALTIHARIMPANAHEELGDVLATDAIGTGPYRLTSYAAGSRLELERNENYWGGTPALDSLNFVMFEDFGAVASNLRSGDIDAVWAVEAFQYPDVADVAGTKALDAGDNTNDWMPQLGKEPLNDPEVRKALRHCFDWDQMNQASFGGEGVRTVTYLDATRWASGVTADVEFDPDRARAMLEAAGASGIEVPIISSPDAIPERNALIMQEGFRAAGMVSEVDVVDGGTWFELAYINRDWEGLISQAGHPHPFPSHWTLAFYLSQQTTGSAFTDGPPHPEMAELLANIEVAHGDQYDELMMQADRMIVEEALTFPTLYAPMRCVVPENLEGLEINSFGHVSWDGAHYT